MSKTLKIIVCIIYLIISVGGLTLVKLGNGDVQSTVPVIPILNIKLSWYTIFGVVLYGISFVLYVSIVSNMQFGRILPLLAGCANIMVLFVSYFLLKELLSIKNIVGAVIIIVGIYIMNM